MSDLVDQKLTDMRQALLHQTSEAERAGLAGAYRDVVRAQRGTFEHRRVVAALEKWFGGRRPEDVRVLDHGCGGGSTVFALMALGYRQAYGVHIGTVAEANRMARLCFGATEDHFLQYDGRRLPFADGRFDFIVSEQVLEHVTDDAVEDYYGEEARVLAPGGACLHQVPHRWAPYDSHSNTWLIHYLPRAAQAWFYRRVGRDAAYFRETLFLRPPGFHYRQLRRHFAGYEDVTLERVLEYDPARFFDGPKGARNMLDRAVRHPLTGPFVRPVAKWGVQLETVAFQQPASEEAR